MINIKRFEQYVEELAKDVNSICDNKIANVILGVNEDHIAKQLKDKIGISLCVSFPDASGNGTDNDNKSDGNACIFFIVEKINVGSENYNQMIDHYSKWQDTMLALREKIIQNGDDVVFACPYLKNKIEWEYQIFSGFNGLSLGITFEDYDRTTY